jgi:hypothetical protein
MLDVTCVGNPKDKAPLNINCSTLNQNAESQQTGTVASNVLPTVTRHNPSQAVM